MKRVVCSFEFLVLSVELVAEPNTKGKTKLSLQLCNIMEGTYDKAISSDKKRRVVGLLVLSRDNGKRHRQRALRVA